MHIKDHSAAMKFFRTYDNVASKGKWKEFVDEMEFDSMVQEPRTMAQEPRNMYAGGQLVQNTVDGSRPGYGKSWKKGNSAYEAELEKSRKLRADAPEGMVWDKKLKKYRKTEYPKEKPKKELTKTHKKRVSNFESETGLKYLDQTSGLRHDIREGQWTGEGKGAKFRDPEFIKEMTKDSQAVKLRNYLNKELKLNKGKPIEYKTIDAMLKKAKVSDTITADASRILKGEFKDKIILSSTKDPLYGKKSEIFREHLRKIGDPLKEGEKKIINISKELKSAGLELKNVGGASAILNETEFKNLFIVLSTEEKSMPMIKRIAEELATDSDLTHYVGKDGWERLAKAIYGNDSVSSMKKVAADASKYAEFLIGARDVEGLRIPSVDRRGDLLSHILDEKNFSPDSGVIRARMKAIRDSLLKSTDNLSSIEKKIVSKIGKKHLDHAIGISATYETAPGYAELGQVLRKKVNLAKKRYVDLDFTRIFNQVLEGKEGPFSFTDFDGNKKVYNNLEEVVGAFNKKSRAFQRKYGADSAIIEWQPGKKLKAENFIKNFKYLSPEAKVNVQELASKGIAIKTKAMPMGKLLDNWWCGKKAAAEGGRIGFKAGSGCPDSVKRRNFLMLTNDVSTRRVTGEAAKEIAEQAGKVVAKAGSKSALASIFGPAGIGLDIAFEVGSIGVDVLGGKSWNRALQDNWLTGAFISGTGQEEFHKELYAKDSKAKPYGQAQDLIVSYNNAQKTIDFVKQSNYRARGQKEEALRVAERDLRGIEAQYNALTKHGKIMEEGSNEYENYMAAKTEFEDTAKAKSYASKQKLKYALDPIQSDRAISYQRGEPVKIDFSLPPNYTTFKADLPTREDLNKIWQDQGFEGTLPADSAKEFITEEKWRQEFEQPGIRGTQDWRGATGGLAGLMKKYYD